jgi:adenosylhomocysteine nucleosidase
VLPPLLLVAALPEEAEAVRLCLGATEVLVGHGFGGWRSEHAVLVLGGVGKVEAATSATAAALAVKPSAVVSVGTCGAIAETLQPGDVLLGERVLQWDFALHHDVMVHSAPELMARVEAVAGCRRGVLASGDYPVSDDHARAELRARFQADAVDMESAAIGRVAQRLGLPFLAVRAVSDHAGPGSHAQFQRHGVDAAARAARAASALLPAPPGP